MSSSARAAADHLEMAAASAKLSAAAAPLISLLRSLPPAAAAASTLLPRTRARTSTAAEAEEEEEEATAIAAAATPDAAFLARLASAIATLVGAVGSAAAAAASSASAATTPSSAPPPPLAIDGAGDMARFLRVGAFAALEAANAYGRSSGIALGPGLFLYLAGTALYRDYTLLPTSTPSSPPAWTAGPWFPPLLDPSSVINARVLHTAVAKATSAQLNSLFAFLAASGAAVAAVSSDGEDTVIALRLPATGPSSVDVLLSVLHHAAAAGLSVQFELPQQQQQDKVLNVLTVIGRAVAADFLAQLFATFSELSLSCSSIKTLRTQSGGPAAADGLAAEVAQFCVEGSVEGFGKLKGRTLQMGVSNKCSISVQDFSVAAAPKRLIVFDMDSTLIQQEVIDEIARDAGVVRQVAEITESAMNGEIDFKESLRRRVGLLKGASAEIISRVRQRITFTPGARELCRILKKLGLKMAVISGGFMPLALYVKAELQLDYAFANQLRVSPDGKILEGETVGEIVDAARKAELLRVIAQAEGVSKEQIIAVGDGANDLIMLAAAGLGIAFNAKPRVQEQASARINEPSLLYVLYLLGYSAADIQRLQQSL